MQALKNFLTVTPQSFNETALDIFNFQSDFVNNNHEYINMHNSIYEIDDLLFSSNYF